MAAFEKEGIQKQIQQDWANREYIEIITGSIKKIADFLNSFGLSSIISILIFNINIIIIIIIIEYRYVV
jgi:uncharacterized protein